MADMVNHPPHYKDISGIECIEVTRYMGFCGGNCFKYVYRAGRKGSIVEDLEKAIFYANEAGDLHEAITPEIIMKIEMIAMYRDYLIFQAMMAIRDGAWSIASSFLRDEIARLKCSGSN